MYITCHDVTDKILISFVSPAWFVASKITETQRFLIGKIKGKSRPVHLCLSRQMFLLKIIVNGHNRFWFSHEFAELILNKYAFLSFVNKIILRQITAGDS